MEWMPIRVLLYIAAVDGKPIDNVIAEWTWFWNYFRRHGMTPELAWMLRKWSHAELWVPDETGLFGGIYMQGNVTAFCGTCWTSTMGQVRDKNSKEPGGTCRRPASQVLKHPERWSVSDDIWLPLPVYAELLGYMCGKVANNQGYDKLAAGSYVTPWRFHAKDKEICSEHVHDDLTFAAFRWQYNNIMCGRSDCRPEKDYMRLINYLQDSETDVPSPLLLGINLIKAGIWIKDLAV